MKGIVLAGGNGTRLYPLTLVLSKQLIPVYDKPMIYYPISTLILAGISEILIITTPKYQKSFQNLLGDGSSIGCHFSYKVQKNPNGLVDAFILGEDFIGKESVALILGDNIFYSPDMKRMFHNKINLIGGSIFAYRVKNPGRYGVVELDDSGKVISMEEKPKNPRSNYAIPGLYFYNSSVVDIAKSIKTSIRGELEIIEVNNAYLKKGTLQVTLMDREVVWFDTGTFDDLFLASQFIQEIEKKKGFKIGSIEEAAYQIGFINKKQFFDLLRKKPL